MHFSIEYPVLHKLQGFVIILDTFTICALFVISTTGEICSGENKISPHVEMTKVQFVAVLSIAGISQCHIVSFVGAGNHKGLPLRDMQFL
ncbi:hypothetical protein PN36_34290 [Candidatus Thiomargarita nelsonii]|uniref:Uncharacterized protein n=1 Tax=Candidatus Thiomargarita nelsonii TaxID=1003181 RepID=A0A4E0QKE5_9GAMM|nr:hypothetical protein PN36_34290 [Candidatus Thiomargarita nelsonii]